MLERIQKILSTAGIASRRKAEQLILEGRITVNGRPASIGMKADIQKDHIKVDGKLIKRTQQSLYLMLNKPRGYITSLSDPEGRPTVRDLIQGIRHRVYPVGRLDFDSEGLLILTNDGELTNAILHPGREVPKTYVVKVKGVLDDTDIEKLRKGIKLEDGLTAPAQVRRKGIAEANSWIEITIYEGRKRQIRRMIERLNHSVIRLKRIGIDGIELGSLPPGAFRYLSADEIRRLKKEVMMQEVKAG